MFLVQSMESLSTFCYWMLSEIAGMYSTTWYCARALAVSFTHLHYLLCSFLLSLEVDSILYTATYTNLLSFISMKDIFPWPIRWYCITYYSLVLLHGTQIFCWHNRLFSGPLLNCCDSPHRLLRFYLREAECQKCMLPFNIFPYCSLFRFIFLSHHLA